MTQVVDDSPINISVKFEACIFIISLENKENMIFYKKSQIFRILTAVKSENRHTVFKKVVDNGLMNISAKFEACTLKNFQEKSFLAHIDCSQIEIWPQNGRR